MAKDLFAPVGVMDSGLGGVSVLLELVRLLPHEHFIYYGDSAYAPYGERDPETIKARAFFCAKQLYDSGAKALVVACNTATGVAIRDIREKFQDIPVIGIEPAIKPASMQTDSPRVVVMATPVTLRQGKFQELIGRFTDKADIIPVPCRGLVELIEAGILEGPELEKAVSDCLSPALSPVPDSIVLGCTHYPLIKETIGKAVFGLCGRHVPLLDGGEGTARQTMRLLCQNGLMNPVPEEGRILWRTSARDGAEDRYRAFFEQRRKETT